MTETQWTFAVFATFAIALTALRAWNKDTRGAFMIGVVVVLLALLLFAVGCSVSPERRPYMEVGMAHEFAGTVGSNPACIVRLRAPVMPGRITVGYTHHSSCRDLNDANTIDQIEVMATIPLGRSK